MKMILEKRKTMSGNVKFSIIAFGISEVLGIISMGALGFAAYYLVSPLFPATFPPESKLPSGDWLWPTIIFISIIWPFGFAFAAIAYYYLSKNKLSKFLLITIYIFIIWLWILAVWYFFLHIANVAGLH